MKLFKNFNEHFESINQLIIDQKTGSLKEFAKQVNLSEWRLQQYLKIIRHVLRAPLSFDNRRKTYYYRENGSVCLIFQENKSLNIDINGFCGVLNQVHQDFITGQCLGSQNN